MEHSAPWRTCCAGGHSTVASEGAPLDPAALPWPELPSRAVPLQPTPADAIKTRKARHLALRSSVAVRTAWANIGISLVHYPARIAFDEPWYLCAQSVGEALIEVRADFGLH